ncbi:hypothetical protein FW778_16045 [Ginsengibacter hankyongi]|uniref:PKD domain-containing protein n=1 Tax=Ginsengibacter hankyongi TaxID=2607284 RepID=A0A5J5IF41_9BACT|nr:hypothetical protein [Ginsengibacter hankyongi]KAA9037605.1 hypothetical protein FW778_16045 [Ginsengibacter hankyongi]
MKRYKIISFLILMIVFSVSCKKDVFNDTSFVKNAASSSKLSVMFDITHDNTGLVTITPNGEGAVSYDIYYGDATAGFLSVAAGKNTQHIYVEGDYTVKVVAHDIKGGTATFTQQLTVAFQAPENLKVNVAINSVAVTVSATALYETLFKVYWGDSSNINPVPFTSFLEGQTVTHTYTTAGTFIVKVVALSGGAATSEYLDTIKVASQIDLPVTFDDPKVDYTVSDFGGNRSSIAADPVTSGNNVLKSVKTGGAQVWAGTTIGTALGFATKIPITPATSRMTVRVYSPAAGLDVKLKIEDHNDNTHSVETDVKTTLANQWEMLTFDFKNQATGTAAIDYTYNYDKASIFFDFGNPGAGGVFYCDDLMMATVTLAQINLPVTFEDAKVDYAMTDFGGNNTTLTTDPSNNANHVMMSTKTSGAQVWAGTTIGTAAGFSSAIPLTSSATKMTVRVYSPAAGIDVKLKVEDHNNGANSVETDAITTLANQWETLTFDFSSPASGTPSWNPSFTYDKASIFFDFGKGGDGRVYYWDDVQMAAAVPSSQINLPVNFEDPNIDYTMTDFGNNVTVDAIDPVVTTNHVKLTTKPAGAQTWAGTTIGTPLGFATPIAFTAGRLKMTVRVYSPAAGIDVKLKVEDHNDPTRSVETDVLTTVANQWETLTFDFSQPASGTASWNPSFTYDKASIFFDFGNTGDGRVYYWDDVKFL